MREVRYLWAAAVAAAALLVPNVARAHGDPFGWPYPRGGFHGEADLIRALKFLRLVSVCDDPTHFYARRAEALSIRAYQLLCQPAARSAAARAIVAIRLYRRTHLPGYLSEAAQSIQHALLAEARCHCSGILRGPRAPVLPGLPVPPVPGAPTQPVPRPSPVPAPPSSPTVGAGWSSSGWSIWAITLRF